MVEMQAQMFPGMEFIGLMFLCAGLGVVLGIPACICADSSRTVKAGVVLGWMSVLLGALTVWCFLHANRYSLDWFVHMSPALCLLAGPATVLGVAALGLAARRRRRNSR